MVVHLTSGSVLGGLFPGRLGEVKFGYDTFFRARWSLVLSLTEVYIAYSNGTFTVLISRWRIIIGGGH